MTNPLIEKARASILEKVDPRLAPVVTKVVEAGKRVMYSQQTRGLAIQQMKSGTDPETVGAAVTKLAAVLFNESKQTIPMNVLLPATMLLLFEALEFLEEAGTLKVDAQNLAGYTQATASGFLQMLGVTPEKLQGMVGQAMPSGPAAAAPQPAAGIVEGA
jgi:hypothetical protein